MTKLSRTYTDRSNCRKAAIKAHGADGFTIEKTEGGFAFRALPAPRFGTSSPAIVNDQPPGFKRLRAAPKADAVREATVADQAEGRADALRRITAAQEAERAAERTPRKGAAMGLTIIPTAQAAPAPKAAKLAPKEGTTSRRVFDMLARPEGATAKECAAAGLAGVSIRAYATDFAKSFPHLRADITKDGAVDRARLVLIEQAAA